MKKRILSLVCALAMLLSGASIALAEGDVIKVGGLAPLTGDVAVYGIATQRGVDLYIEELNAAGGVLGKQVEIEWLDEKGDVTEALNAYNRLAGEVVAIIGDVTSKPTIAVSELAAQDGIPMIAPPATAYDVTSAGENIFRACFLDPYQGQMMATFAAGKLGAKKVAVIYNNADDYSTGLAESFKAKAEELGAEVVAYESYATGDIDFKSQLTKISEAAPEAIFVPDYYNTVALIASQTREVGITAPLMGADGWDGVLGVVNDPALVEGYYFCNHYSTEDTDEVVQNFLKNYEAKYGETPNAFAALGYDAAKILFTAMETAGTTESAAVVEAMKNTDLNGVTGNITFDDHRDPQKSVAICQFVNGEAKLVEKLKP